jgi:hypothetical protein
MPLRETPVPGRNDTTRKYTLIMYLDDPEDADIWAHLQRMPDRKRQVLVKQALRHGLQPTAGRVSNEAPGPPAPSPDASPLVSNAVPLDDDEDDIETFSV